MKRALSFVVLFVMLFQGIGIALSPTIREPYDDYNFYGLENVPLDISHLWNLNPKFGDILYSPTSATLVAINEHQAFYLDFNVRYSPVHIMYEPESTMCAPIEVYNIIGGAGRGEYIPTCIPYPQHDYMVVGNVEIEYPFIAKVLKSYYDDLWKQFIIWKYLGVEESALRTAWLKAYGRSTFEYDLLYKTSEMAYAKDNSQGTDLETAVKFGYIRVDYEANGYTSVDLDVYSYKQVIVNINLGQIFENKGGSNQDLGVAEPVTIFMPNGVSKYLNIKTYCINLHKGVPSSRDVLAAGGGVGSNVKQEITIQYVAGRTSTGAAQSAVWRETDGSGNNYTTYELEELGVSEQELNWITSDSTDLSSDPTISDLDEDFRIPIRALITTLLRIFEMG